MRISASAVSLDAVLVLRIVVSQAEDTIPQNEGNKGTATLYFALKQCSHMCLFEQHRLLDFAAFSIP